MNNKPMTYRVEVSHFKVVETNSALRFEVSGNTKQSYPFGVISITAAKIVLGLTFKTKCLLTAIRTPNILCVGTLFAKKYKCEMDWSIAVCASLTINYFPQLRI